MTVSCDEEKVHARARDAARSGRTMPSTLAPDRGTGHLAAQRSVGSASLCVRRWGLGVQCGVRVLACVRRTPGVRGCAESVGACERETARWSSSTTAVLAHPRGRHRMDWVSRQSVLP